jgi:hypothetical protein
MKAIRFDRYGEPAKVFYGRLREEIDFVTEMQGDKKSNLGEYEGGDRYENQ